MNFQDLDQFLIALNPAEIEKKANMAHQNSNELSDEAHPFMMHDRYFIPEGQRITFYQNERFTYVRPHKHSFIEMIYVYSGSCLQVINGKNVTMKKGEICILDTNVVHSISTTQEDDLVINCLMTKSYFDISFLSRLAGNDLLSSFFVQSVFQGKDHNNYILFSSSENATLDYIMKQLLCEYFGDGLCKEEVINSYMIILFSELLRIHKHELTQRVDEAEHKWHITDVLGYIQSNYHTIDLTSTAQYFNFNASYLSRLIKQTTGKSFMDIIHTARINRCCLLLETTDIPIMNLIHDVGYSNTKYFYQLFRKYKGCTPLEYREKKSTS